MADKEFTIGNVVTIPVTFLDKYEEIITPLGDAIIKISFPIGPGEDDYDTVELDMDIVTDGTATVEWATEGIDAYPGRAFWSARSTNPVAKVDDWFDLKANRANLSDVGT